MYKEAFSAGEFIERHQYPLAVGSAMGISMLMHYLTRKRLEKQIEESEKVTPEQAKKILTRMGLPSHLPMVPYDKTRNAFYAAPRSAKFLYKRDRRVRKALREHFGERRVAKHLGAGLIGYHPDYLRENIIAHEAGHAHIRNRPWHSPSRINQSVARPLSNALSIASPIATLLGAGILGGMTYHKTGNPVLSGLAGAGTGLGLAAMMNAPTLINENQASWHAKKYLDATSKDDERKAQEKEALNTAYKTYLLGSLAVPTLYGAAIGGVGIPSKLGRALR